MYRSQGASAAASDEEPIPASATIAEGRALGDSPWWQTLWTYAVPALAVGGLLVWGLTRESRCPPHPAVRPSTSPRPVC